MLTLRTRLDMTPGSRSRVEIPVSQYDTAVTIVLALYASADSGFTIPSGTTASIRGRKPDGNVISKAVGISGNMVTVELDKQMTAVAGRSIYEIVLESGGEELSSQNFVLSVERAAMDKDSLVSGSEIRELVDVIDRADEIMASAGDSEAYAIGTRGGVAVSSTDPAYQNNSKYWAEHGGGESIAPQFSTSVAYAVGEYVLYENHLYRFATAHPAGAWDASHVTEATAMGEVSNLIPTQAEINLQNAIAKSIGVGYPVESPDPNVYFADEDGKIGIILRDGFDSADAGNGGIETFYHPDYPNGAIVDGDGNLLGVLSAPAGTPGPLRGKTFSILGDSISTYQGYIPSGYAVYYPRGDVDNVEKTWWKKLIALSGMTLVKNASWSGSTVTGNTGSSSAAAGCSDARINDLKDGTTVPDIIICYITTNDWALNKELGSYDSKEDVDTTSATISNIADAYALMLYKIRNTYPNAIVYCVTSLEGRRVSGDSSYPIINTQGNTLHEVNHVVEEVAHIFGARVIDLQTCGIHYWNVANYTVDGTLHPNNAGTTVIADVINRRLVDDFK